MTLIKFDIQNPDSTPPGASVLYLGQANTLHFVYYNESDLKALNPGDLFTIKIPQTLLTAATAANMTDPNWSVQTFTAPGSDSIYYSFVLTPLKPLDFKDSLIIVFSGLEGATATNDDVTTLFVVKNRALPGYSTKLFVLAHSQALGDLHDYLTFQQYINIGIQSTIESGIVYLSPLKSDGLSENNTEEIALPVSNQISVNLKYSGGALVSQWDPTDPPVFIFSFSYSTDSLGLTDALKTGEPGYNALTSAWEIQASLGTEEGEQALWTAPDANQSAGAPAWVVKPLPSNINLFSNINPDLDLEFKHVITVLPPGEATLFIQWHNIPGFNDGTKALNLPKEAPAVRVLDFSGPNGQRSVTLPNLQAMLNLQWSVFGATDVTLYFPDGNSYSKIIPVDFDTNNPQLFYSGSLQGEIVPVLPLSDFRLTAFDANGNASKQSDPVSIRVADFEPPKITQFNGVLQYLAASGNYSIELTWEVLNTVYDTFARISGDPEDYVYRTIKSVLYTLDVQHPIAQNYTLTVTDLIQGDSDNQTIPAPIPDDYKPAIVSFGGSIVRDAQTGLPGLQIQFETNILGNGGYLLLDDTVTIPHTGGKGTYTVPVSADKPLKYQYSLTAVNVILNLKSKEVPATLTYAAGTFDHVTLDAQPLQIIINSAGDEGLIYLVQNELMAYAHFNPAVTPDHNLLTSESPGVTLVPRGGNGFGMSIGDDNRVYLSGTPDDGTAWFIALFKFDVMAFTFYMPSEYSDAWPVAPAVIVDQTAWFPANQNRLVWYNLKANTFTIQQQIGFNSESILNTIPGPDGKTVLIVGDEGSVGWFDGTQPPIAVSPAVTTDLASPDTKEYHQTLIKKIAVTAAGKVYVTGNNPNYSIVYFDIKNPTAGSNAGPGNMKFRNITVSKDEAFLILLDPDGKMTVTPGPATPFGFTNICQSPDAPVIDAAISIDNTRIFALTADNQLQILEPTLVASIQG